MSDLKGKSAAELRIMLAAGDTTAKAVIDHIQGKDKIAHPSKVLLAELTGTELPKAKAKAKPAAKPAAKAPAKKPVVTQPPSKTMEPKTHRNIERMKLIGEMASHIMSLAKAFEELEG